MFLKFFSIFAAKYSICILKLYIQRIIKNPMSTRILVIDDEESLCDILKYNLERAGYQVDCSYSAAEALERNLKVYSLFIVDIMMEHLSGYDFVQRLRCMPGTENIPVIFCSALDGEDDKVTGLDLGGDDYITKPFVITEVLARVRAVLRRAAATNPTQAPQPDNRAEFQPDVVYKGIRIDQNTKKCTIDGESVSLTRTEYDLLLFFLTHAGRIYSREQLISSVWPPDVYVTERAIDTNITRLRRKLGQYGNCIETRQGFGYGFNEAN